MSFSIFTDTSANLTSSIVRENDITVIPLSYFVDGVECKCATPEDFSPGEFYESMRRGARITTSQLNPHTFAESMRPALEAGTDILFVGMSSGISGTFHSAEIAVTQLREEFPEREIYLVDSLGASLGEGILVIKAIECRKQGMDAKQTAELLIGTRPCVYQVFTVDDLMYLRKGGRLSNITAIAGTILNIKPLLKGDENGKIISFGRTRGRNSIIEMMGKKFCDLAVEPEKQTVYISHADCAEDAGRLAAVLREQGRAGDVFVVDHEPVTGSYLGPGALALYFLGDRNVRKK